MRGAPSIITTMLVLMPLAAVADDAADDAARGVFERRCVSCHNAQERKGGLSLASLNELNVGGDSGPAVVAGKPGDSLLLDYVSGEKPEMPKGGPPLTGDEVAAIRTWISAGAKWPADLVLQDRSLADTNWWSLKPLVRPGIPEIRNPKSTFRNPIDAFIVSKLEENGLPQSPAADRRTLIRRLYFDLVGLPPRPDEVDAFLADADPQAYERLVDRLLASPHYGERWARHWLDVVHYGETHGYDKDKPRPNAWPYRDYVIRSLNSDKPYGRFAEEQIAGDVLYPDSPDGIEALGFLAAGPWDFIGHTELPETKIDGKVARHLDRDDMVQNTTGTFLSLTVGCAQCHNHKFDPITQREYYGLQAVFAALDRTDKPYDRDPAVAKRRGELIAQLARIAVERKTIEEATRERGGEVLAELDRRLTELANTAAVKERPEFGYHSQMEGQQDVTKWVQVDLGRSHPIARIEYVACHDDFNGIGAGFGFPLRYRIEASDDVQFMTGVTLLVDQMRADVPNPGVVPQAAGKKGVRARFVRVTATKLAPRLPTDYIFALAELSVFDPAGKNLAAGAEVTSLDSIEAPVRWRRTNLVDGYYFGQASGAASRLAQTQKERESLVFGLLDAVQRSKMEELAVAMTKVGSELKALPPQQMVYAGTAFRGEGNFRGTGGVPRPIFLLDRGNVAKPREAVGPGALVCISLPGVKLGPGASGTSVLTAGDHTEGDRRAALAGWIADRQNPLIWRSMANRVWQYHFGRGIVDTPNDFGRMGAKPTHPELLDWLAVELRDGGQSLKQLHRLIALSHTYRQSTQIADCGLQVAESSINPQLIDADNRYLWRANRRRLEAEALRDAVLLVAGKLDTTMGGPGFQDFVMEQPEHSPHYEYHLHDPDDPRSHRRSIYRFIVRSQPQPFMTTLDCADPSQRVDKRNESLSALQALATLNNGFMVTMSKHWAERLARRGGDLSAQVDRAVCEGFGRRATAEERELLAEYAREHGLANLCRVLLNANEFAFVD